MRRILGALVIVAGLCPSGEAMAQAWTRDAGDVFISANYRFIRATSFYQPDGNTTPLASTFLQNTLGIYGEVGVVDRWLTLVVDGELFRRNTLKNQGATQGMGDLRLGLWSGLLTAPFHLSAGAVLGIPTGDPDPDGVEPTASLLPTGDGEFDLTLNVAAGHSFGGGDYPLQHFAQVLVGYAIRNEIHRAGPGAGNIRDQIVYQAKFGTKVAKPGADRFWFVLHLSGQETLGGGAAPSTVAGLGDGVNFTSFGLEVLADIAGGFGLGFGADGAFRGANVPAAPAFKFSLTYQSQN